MTNIIKKLAALSLILGIAGCQTLNNTQDKSAKEDTSTHLSVASAYLEDGHPEKALFELRSLLEREPANIRGLTLMGLTQLALHNPKKAVTYLEAAWDKEPSAQNALNLSSGYIENKNYESAQKIIVTGLAIKESPPYRNKERFYHNLGLIAERRGKLVAAEKSYKKAIEENPTFYLSRAKLAKLLEERQKFDDAKQHWEIARTSCPGCFDATQSLVQYYRRKGDLRTAIGLVRDYKKIEGLNPIEAKKANELETELDHERKISAADKIPDNSQSR